MAQPPDKLNMFQVTATIAAIAGLTVCLVFVLWAILPALLWAGVLTIATWPTYNRILKWGGPGLWQRFGAPLTLTLFIGLVVAAPVALAALEVGREAREVLGWLEDARRFGIAMPDTVGHLPWFGARASDWWHGNLSDPRGATNLLRQVGPGQLMGLTRSFGPEILHRLLLFVITLATLFFLFRDGRSLGARLVSLGEMIFGARGAPIAQHVVEAIHGTVDGLVLVGLAEGAVLGAGYWIAGVPHPLALAIATGIVAIIPLGAPLAFCLAALFLLGSGKAIAAVALVVFGFLTVFVTDHIVRPVLIGGASKVPFLLVLLGLLGGISSIGLVGLFIGPALMAVLMVIWRDVAEYSKAHPESSETAPVP